MLQGSAILHLCVHCFSTGSDIRQFWCREPRNIKQTKAVRIKTGEKAKGAKQNKAIGVEEVSTKDSWSAGRKCLEVFCCPARSLSLNSVIWLHVIRACTCYLRLYCCTIGTVELESR